MFGEMTNKHGIFCLVCLSLGIVVADAENVTDAQENILSRQKRYLIFPQGSNVQLVYCLTIGAFAPSPDQIVVGMTAALAWELPSQVDKKITKLLHRRTRSLVFPKIEAFLQSAGLDGRACVMRAICEARNRDNDKIGTGTFVQEVLHAIFRVSELSTLHLRTRLLTLLLLFTEGTFNNSTSLLKFFILSLQFNKKRATNEISNISPGQQRPGKANFFPPNILDRKNNIMNLIYCLTIGTYAKPESFFTVGVTAGLAWELPHRDTVPYRKPAEVYHRRSRRELYPKVESILTTNDYLCVEIRAWMQESSLKEVDCNPVDLISNRHYTIDDCKQLYIPIESFSHPLQGFQAKKRGKDGKACVLKALCQAARRNDSDVGKGTFMQEILFSIFTLPSGSYDVDPKTRYELAHDSINDCDHLYPTCSDSFFTLN
ncbi:Protein of unknown function [Cotesia congregata]|uniref:Uncharacterized protein n=1 Tax=Cotesia congregata TaxID=51543 RepID=A0A8J2MRE0_COTCN|nr:Protein of unknown function [Cotesia congregata]